MRRPGDERGGCATGSIRQLDIELAVNGHDATWPVAAYFGFSFAVLGFMVGFTIEARRRDHEAGVQAT